MQVTANWELPIYQVIGPVVRVHWNYRQRTVGEDEQQQVLWVAEEAVVPLDADNNTFVALIDAEGGNGNAMAKDQIQDLLQAEQVKWLAYQEHHPRVAIPKRKARNKTRI